MQQLLHLLAQAFRSVWCVSDTYSICSLAGCVRTPGSSFSPGKHVYVCSSVFHAEGRSSGGIGVHPEVFEGYARIIKAPSQSLPTDLGHIHVPTSWFLRTMPTLQLW